MGTPLTEFALPDIARASRDGSDAGACVFPAGESEAGTDRVQRLMLVLIAVMAVVLVWTGWDFLQRWDSFSARLHVTIAGLLGLCVVAMSVAAGAALHSRQSAAECRRLADLNARLVQERDLLRTIIDTLPDFIYAKDRQGRFVLNNPAHAKDLGAASPAELKGKSDFDYFPRELAEQFFADEQKIIATGESVINQEQHKARPGSSSSEKFWALTSKVLWRDRTGEILGTVGVTRDIHEFKLTQEALRTTEQRLRQVMRRTRCILNFGTVAGPEGWREHALDARTPFQWDFPVQNVEGAQEVCPLDVPAGKTYRDLWIEARNAADDIQMNWNSGNALVNDIPYYRNEFRCTDRHGVEHWMQQFVTIEKLAENRWQVFGITTDVTELKHSEQAMRLSEEKLRRSTTQLEQSNRELQDFAYVASHDLQEPLRKIVVFGDRLKEKCGETLGEAPRDYIERMQKAAGRMQTLINDLLTFSRLTTKASPFKQVRLADVAREVLEDLESRVEQVKGRVEVGELPVLYADALQMRQLLQNLIGNALKFRKADEAPLVKVSARTFSDSEGAAMCELTVSDNGIGFDEKYLDRIFNVFQRLHARSEYEGTGMGLAIVRKIALHHGGTVTAKSRPGQGATFLVTLPVERPEAEAQPGAIKL